MIAVQAGVFGEINFAHTPLADLLQNLVMANGLTDHTIPPTCAVQLPAMLRREAANDNEKGQGRAVVTALDAPGPV